LSLPQLHIIMSANFSSDPYYNELLLKRPFGYTFLETPYFEGFEFEKIDVFKWPKFIEDNWKLAIYAPVVYIALIFGIQRYMKNRPAFELKYPLFLWNLCLGLASFFGFVRVLPAFIGVLSEPNGLYNSICRK